MTATAVAFEVPAAARSRIAGWVPPLVFLTWALVRERLADGVGWSEAVNGQEDGDDGV